MSQVFVSHSHADHDFATRLSSDLRKHGLTVWSAERELEPGEPWVSGIDEAIRDSQNIIVVLSQNSLGSREVPIEAAIALAYGGKRIVPVYSTKSTDAPFLLEGIQGIDMSDSYAYADAIGKLAQLLLEDRKPQGLDSQASSTARLRKAQLAAWMLERERRNLEEKAQLRWSVLRASTSLAAVMSFIVGLLPLAAIVVNDFATPLAALVGAGLGLFGHRVVGLFHFSRSKHDSGAAE